MNSLTQTVLHRALVISLILNILSVSVYAEIGSVTSQTKAARITRKGDKILTEVNTPVEMRDLIETLKGRTNIKFVDDTKVSVTEYSKLLIDEFVYNPEKKTGKLSLKAALGTIRYSSGKIAKNSRQNVKIKSPTASVSVRGTDFTINVQEDGASSFLLLPSTDEAGKSYVGSIDVSTLGGTVTLNKAYEATTVTSAIAPPTPPVVIQQDGPAVKDKDDNKKDNLEKDNNAEDNKDEQKLQDIEKKYGFSEKGKGKLFFREGKIGVWKNNVDSEIIKKIETIFKNEMSELGYL